MLPTEVLDSDVHVAWAGVSICTAEICRSELNERRRERRERRKEGERRIDEQREREGSTCESEFTLWEFKLCSELFIFVLLLVVSGCQEEEKKEKMKNRYI